MPTIRVDAGGRFQLSSELEKSVESAWQRDTDTVTCAFASTAQEAVIFIYSDTSHAFVQTFDCSVFSFMTKWACTDI